MSLSFHRGVSDHGSDSLLDITLDRVFNTFGMSLGISSGLSSVGLSLLGGALSGHSGVSDRVTDCLLGASEIGAGGIGESFSHVWELICVVGRDRVGERNREKR